MKEITVMGSPLILTAGIVKLTKKQAKRREHCLKPYFDDSGKRVTDCYEIVAENWFKVGESIGYAGKTGDLRPDIATSLITGEQIAEKDALIEDLRKKLDELTTYATSIEEELAQVNAKKKKADK